MKKAIIYKITNKITNKVYIGCTTASLESRYKGHIHRCFKKNYNSKLYNSMRKYGKENFQIELLQECDINFIYELEKKYIAEYNSYENGLNSTLGGEGCLGYSHSEEKRKKISKNLLDGGNTHKNKSYSEIYGENFQLEKEKRKRGVSDSWKNMSDEDRNKRKQNISKGISNSNKIKNIRKGSDCSWAIPILVDGIYFGSIIEARKTLQLSKYLLFKNHKIEILKNNK